MGRVVVLGERHRVIGYRTAGADVQIADDPPTVRRAWSALGPDVALVVLTLAAAASIAADLGGGGRLVAVMPP